MVPNVWLRGGLRPVPVSRVNQMLGVPYIKLTHGLDAQYCRVNPALRGFVGQHPSTESDEVERPIGVPSEYPTWHGIVELDVGYLCQ